MSMWHCNAWKTGESEDSGHSDKQWPRERTVLSALDWELTGSDSHSSSFLFLILFKNIYTKY